MARTLSKYKFVLHGGTGSFRKETLQGTEYYVCPVVMMTPGVYTANLGAMLYMEEVIGARPEEWNNRPITCGHPIDSAGNFCSANSAEAIESFKIGMVLNAAYNGKLTAEAWIDINLAKKYEPRIIANIEQGVPTEVSTGMFVIEAPATGEHNGKPYLAIAQDPRPDHLAILVDKKGACSMADGAGLLVMQEALAELPEVDQAELRIAFNELVANQVSHDRIRTQIREQLRDMEKSFEEYVYMYIEDVYSDFVIVRVNDKKLYKMNFDTQGHKVNLTGTVPVEVEAILEYRTMDGTLVGNQSQDEVVNDPLEKENDMTKAALVHAVIKANPMFNEGDREMLLNVNEARLEEFATAPTPEPADPVKEPVKAPAVVANQVSWDDLFATASPEVQEVLAESIDARNLERATIVANVLDVTKDAPVYSKEDLDGMKLADLRKVSALVSNMQATKPSAAPQRQTAPALFGGQAGYVPSMAQAPEDVLGDDAALEPLSTFEPAS